MRDEILKLFPNPPSSTQLAYITTASKVESDPSFVQIDKKALTDAGFRVEDIDIESKTPNELRDLLKNKDGIYVQGGNTFYLLKQSRLSGFDTLVRDLVAQGIPYIGASAGSYVACPTIEMATWKHQDRNRFGISDLRSFNLVDFLITAHYKPKHDVVLKKFIAQTHYPVHILTDQQALLVRGNRISLVGHGPEIKLK